MTDKNDKKPITKDNLKAMLNAVKSGRTSPSFVASELMSRLGSKVKDIEFKKRGGLVGGQKKLDKNKDGKITGADFKMMKKKKTVKRKKK